MDNMLIFYQPEKEFNQTIKFHVIINNNMYRTEEIISFCFKIQSDIIKRLRNVIIQFV